MKILKELFFIVVITLITTVSVKGEYTQTFDDGSLKTTEQACKLALNEHIKTVRICSRKNTCLEQDHYLRKRIVKIENFKINNCEFNPS